MPTFGVTINEHMLHALSGDVVQVLDGELTEVPAWSGEIRQELPAAMGEHEFSFMGHPEPLSWHRSIPGLERATFRWSWLEPATTELWRSFVRTGMAGTEEVPGTGMSPRSFLARMLDSDQGARLPGAMPSDRPRGSAWRVVAEGTKDGQPARAVVDHVIEYANLRCGGDTLTAYPAARAALSLATGEIDGRGVLTPEEVLDAESFVREYAEHTGTRLDRYVSV